VGQLLEEQLRKSEALEQEIQALRREAGEEDA
jgi:hypothetical protein